MNTNPASGDEEDLQKKGEAFAAAMQARIEQARANGESSEQIKEEVTAYARAEARQQAPQVVARARSWWSGFRNFLIVGALALGLAIGLALFVEHSYTAPFCEKYASQHSLVYSGFQYPTLGRSSSTSSLGRCMFADAAGQSSTVDFSKVNSNAILALLVSFALQIEITIPVFFILVAMLAVAISRLR
jgi:hypothetical protein